MTIICYSLYESKQSLVDSDAQIFAMSWIRALNRRRLSVARRNSAAYTISRSSCVIICSVWLLSNKTYRTHSLHSANAPSLSAQPLMMERRVSPRLGHNDDGTSPHRDKKSRATISLPIVHPATSSSVWLGATLGVAGEKNDCITCIVARNGPRSL